MFEPFATSLSCQDESLRVCVCVYIRAYVCVCAVSSVTALGASHSLPPCDEIQMETSSELPTLLAIMAAQIFYFGPRLFEIL